MSVSAVSGHLLYMVLQRVFPRAAHTTHPAQARAADPRLRSLCRVRQKADEHRIRARSQTQTRPAPGLDYVDRALWDNRDRDPVSLRRTFQGPTAREWLPFRAYEDGIYALFTNPVGMDGDQVRNGNCMIIDPHGGSIADCRSFGDEVVIGTGFPERIDLYGPPVAPSETTVSCK